MNRIVLLLLLCAAGLSAQVRNARYCEMLVVVRHALSGTATLYNTLGLNQCPAERWNAIDLAKVRKERGAIMIVPNGPRYFMMDRNAIQDSHGLGEPVQFGGLELRPLATFEVRPGMEQKPYRESVVDRQFRFVYEAGKKVYELTSPDGHVHIMQSYSVEVDPALTEAGLDGLAARLKFPAGWSYGVRTLTADLEVRSEGMRAYVMQDELKNTYQRLK